MKYFMEQIMNYVKPSLPAEGEWIEIYKRQCVDTKNYRLSLQRESGLKFFRYNEHVNCVERLSLQRESGLKLYCKITIESGSGLSLQRESGLKFTSSLYAPESISVSPCRGRVD